MQDKKRGVILINGLVFRFESAVSGAHIATGVLLFIRTFGAARYGYT